jgi:hypothetical protein
MPWNNSLPNQAPIDRLKPGVIIHSEYCLGVSIMINFRGHHLVCLHFFQGEGYSRDFVNNLKNLLTRAENGEIISICSGADDICRACPSLKDNACHHKKGADSEFKELDRTALTFFNLTTGKTILWSEIKKKITATPKGWFASFCEGCDWEDICRVKQGRV